MPVGGQSGRKLNVVVNANVSNALRGFTRLSQAGSAMGRGVTGVFRGIATAAAVAVTAFGAVAAGAFGLASAASSVNEAMNRTNVVFTDAASGVIKFSETTAKSFGIAQSSALQYSAAFGQILQNTDLGQDEIAELSIELVKLSGDLASFADLSTQDALQKVFSGLAGEIEPLRREGIAMDAASISALALEMGLADVADELTQGDKIQARAAFIMSQAGNITGDYARTQEDLAQQVKSAKAQFQDFLAEVGTNFVPMFTRLFDWVNDEFPNFEKTITEGTGKILDNMSDLWETHGPVIKDIAGKVFEGIGAVYNVLLDVFKTVFNWVGENWPTIKGVFDTVWGGMETVISGVWSVFEESLLPTLIQIKDEVVENWPEIKTKVSDIWEEIKLTFTTIVDEIKAIWEVHGEEILETVSKYWLLLLVAISVIFTIIRGLIKIISGLITGDWQTFWDGMETIFEGFVINFIPALAEWYGNVRLRMFVAGARWMIKLADGIDSQIGAVSDALKRIPVVGQFWAAADLFSAAIHGGRTVIGDLPLGYGSTTTATFRPPVDPRELPDKVEIKIYVPHVDSISDNMFLAEGLAQGKDPEPSYGVMQPSGPG